MNLQKITYLLAAVFIVLLLAASQSIWSEYISIPQLTTNNQETPSPLSFDKEAIDQIVIEKTQEYILTLSKQNNEWLINDKKASASLVERLLTAITTDTVDTVASTNPESFSKYSINEGSALKLTIKQGDNAKEYFVGSRGTIVSSYYLRESGNDTVYQLKGQLVDLIDLQEEDYRDKILVNIQADRIATIQIEQGRNFISIQRDETGSWQAASAGQTTTLGDLTAERLIEAFEPLEASQIATDEQKDTFDSSLQKVRVQVTTTDDEITTFELVDSDEEWLIQTPEIEEVFLLNNAVADSIVLDPEEIFSN